jgi:predicted O-methyltransferase YrrM
MIDPELRSAIQKCLGPDPWSSAWTVAGEFGGGNAVEVEVGEFLHSFVRAVRPKLVVETGTHKGFSSLMIATALKENHQGHLYTVDLGDYSAGDTLKRFGVSDLVTLFRMHSVDFLKSLEIGRVIDFLWLDASHTEEAVLAELESAMPMLKPGSYVGFHDSLIDPMEASAVREIRSKNPSWQYIQIASARGVDLMRVQ